MLRDSLEEQLIAMDFADEEPTPEELCDAQAAHASFANSKKRLDRF